MLRKISYLILLLSGFYSAAFAQDTVSLTYLSTYRGKNVYVQNPFHNDTIFCTYAVRVNGKTQNIVLQRSAYEIDLSSFLQGDSIRIEIVHYRDCLPHILNVHVGHSRPMVFSKMLVSE